MKRLTDKIETMSAFSEKWLAQEHIINPLSKDPVEAFDLLFHSRKYDPKHRLTGLYCYDVRESVIFKNAFKAEIKMREIQQ
jgi:hypothetical protein